MRLTRFTKIAAIFAGISIITVLLLHISSRNYYTAQRSDESVTGGNEILTALPAMLPKILSEKNIAVTKSEGPPFLDTSSIPKRSILLDDTRNRPILLSLNRSVRADVRGNLGPPSVITHESVSNWLTDRWQAASNMGGRPIPGPHWVDVDLGRLCVVERAMIDWEDAFSNSWTLEGRRHLDVGDTASDVLATSASIKETMTKKHVIQIAHTKYSRESKRRNGGGVIAVGLSSSESLSQRKVVKGGEGEVEGDGANAVIEIGGVRYVRLNIHAPATEWGSSIWRLQLWGYEVHDP